MAGLEQSPTVSAKSDARLTASRRLTTIFVHGTLLVSILAFIFYYVMGPWLGLLGLEWSAAKVTILAQSTLEVSAPVDGQFVASKVLTNGARVAKGDLLGHMQNTQTDEKLDAARQALRSMRERLLILDDHRSRIEGTEPQQAAALVREIGESTFKVQELNSDIERLTKLQDRLVLYSAVSGIVMPPAVSNISVRANQSVARIWPDDGDLLIEVEAPAEIINQLIKANRVEARFLTSGDNVTIHAIPVGASVKHFMVEASASKRQEIWGQLQCTPLHIPESIRHPGLIGRLR